MGFTTTPITPGAGVAVAVDDAAGVLFQRMKIVDGVAGGTTGLPVDATRGIPVDPRPKWARIALTPNFSTAAYADGDNMAGEITIPGAVRQAGGLARVRHMTIWCKTPTLAGNIALFFADRPLGANSGAGKTDQDPFAPDAADLPFLTGGWQFYFDALQPFAANSVRFGDDQYYDWAGFPIDVVLRSESNTDAYLYIVARNAIDLTTTTDLGLVLFVEQF